MDSDQLRPLRSTFASPYDQHKDRIGQTFRLLGQVAPSSYDYDECGPLYWIQFADGQCIEAWPEEVFDGLTVRDARDTREDR